MNVIYKLFAQQVKNNPEAIAIIANEQTLTYSALNQQVTDYASHLAKYQKDINIAIGLKMSPSIETIVAMLACIKLNIPYIPLDTSYPGNYIRKILADSQTCHICLPNRNTILIPHTAIAQQIPEKVIAYIIYTSGTSNEPKGVMITYHALKNLILATRPIFNISPKDRIPLFHSIAFDFSVWEIYSTLLNGASLVIVPNELRLSPIDYMGFLQQQEITVLNTTPSFFYQLLPHFDTAQMLKFNLRLIIFGGEKLQVNRLKSWFALHLSNYCTLYNMYGITEGTIHSTYYKITPDDTLSDDSNIGLPLPGIQIAVVDKDNKLVATGTPGELCLGGVSVTPGYLCSNNTNTFINEKLTSKKVIRWFKTGDLVKQSSKGLIYLERNGGFTKIRGYRVHLNQIEKILLTNPLVTNVVVTTACLYNNQESIIAFVESQLLSCDAELTHLLKQNLPQFMLPHRIVLLPHFPLTINNKLDMVALKESILEINNRDTKTDVKRIDHIIESAWCKLLNLSSVDYHCNFFDAGGDSFLLLQLQATLQIQLGKDIALMDLIKYPTVAQQIDFYKKR